MIQFVTELMNDSD